MADGATHIHAVRLTFVGDDQPVTEQADRATFEFRESPSAADLYVLEATMQKPERRIVQPNNIEGWDVTKPSATKASAHTPTKAAALKRARQILGNLGGGELEIRDSKGKVQKREIVESITATKNTSTRRTKTKTENISTSTTPAPRKQTPIKVKKTPGLKSDARAQRSTMSKKTQTRNTGRKKWLP